MKSLYETNQEKLKMQCIMKGLEDYEKDRDPYKDYETEVLANYIMTLKNYGDNNADKLSTKFGISFGRAKSILKSVKTEVDASFKSSKPSTNTQRINNFLKGK